MKTTNGTGIIKGLAIAAFFLNVLGWSAATILHIHNRDVDRIERTMETGLTRIAELVRPAD